MRWSLGHRNPTSPNIRRGVKGPASARARSREDGLAFSIVNAAGPEVSSPQGVPNRAGAERKRFVGGLPQVIGSPAQHHFSRSVT
jgi:hypothetical protein